MKEEGRNSEKLSYEELENIAKQLSSQNEALLNQLQQVMMNNTFRRIDYLFKVVENHINFNTEFVDNVTNELEQLLTLPTEEEEAEDGE